MNGFNGGPNTSAAATTGSNDVCYNILSLLQHNVCPVENVCNICGASHYTQNCPDYSIGEHVRDTPQQNLSRSSIPNGLHIIESEEGTCVVTSQKFAKGSRFGPLLAEKSYIPHDNLKFPLVIFGNPLFHINDPELDQLFHEKNIYLDNRNENNCNWMIHVPPAKYSNEQNLICFQLHNQIYYTAIQDIDVGDILKVWYAPKYAAKMNTKLLTSSPFEIVNNVLKQASMGTLDSFVEDSLNQQIFTSCENSSHNNATNPNKNAEVSLPPINSLMRTPSLTFYQNNNYLCYNSDYSHNYSESESLKYFEPTEMEMNLPSNVDDLNSIAISQCPDLNSFALDASNMFSDSEEGGATSAGANIQGGTGELDGGGNIDESGLLTQSANTPKNSKKKLNDKGEKNPRLKPAAFSCKLCNKTYVAICNLNKHHMQVHNLHLCNLCMKTFETVDLLREHVCPKQTFDSECSKCPICYKVLANPWSLARHVKCTHKGYHLSVKKKEITLEEIDSTADKEDDSKETLLPPPLAETLPDISSDTSSQEKMVIKYEQFSDDDLNLPPLVQISATKIDKTTVSGTVSPVKAAIVKALASKLTKRKSDPAESGSTGVVSGGEGDGENGTTQKVKKKSGTPKKPRETIRTHKCDECGKLYAKKDGLQKHKLTHENRSYFCPFCSHTPVKSNDSLRRHFRVNHSEIQDQWNMKGFINSCIVKSENSGDEMQQQQKKQDEHCWMNEMLLMDNVMKIEGGGGDSAEPQDFMSSPLRATNIVPYNNNNTNSNNKNHLQNACDVKCAKINLPNNNLDNIDTENNTTTTNSMLIRQQQHSSNSNSSSSVQHYPQHHHHHPQHHHPHHNHHLMIDTTTSSSPFLSDNHFTDNHFITDDDNLDHHPVHHHLSMLDDHHHLVDDDGGILDDEFEDAKFLNIFINATGHD